MRPRRLAPVLVGVTGILLVAYSVVHAPAALIDLPANDAAKALRDGEFVNRGGARLVLQTRMTSVQQVETPERWNAIGRAQMVLGDPAKAAKAFERGLSLAPAKGMVWGEYANALAKLGRTSAAAAARKTSVQLAPHDPRAVRVRRNR